jgi:heat shock protein HslJ
MAVTLMACAEGGELERAYLGMLARVESFRLEGATLTLLSGGEALATFRPR